MNLALFSCLFVTVLLGFANLSASSSPCSSDSLSLLVALYIDPSTGSASWTAVKNGASSVPTIAIINPDNGPGSGIQSDYTTGISNLKSGGVVVIGYVYSNYGTGPRTLAQIQTDINNWYTWYPAIQGIFIDEVSSSSSEISFYTTLYNSIKAESSSAQVVLNPGAIPASGYTSISTKIVAFEDVGSDFGSGSVPSYATCSTRGNFAALLYSTSSSNYQAAITQVRDTWYYGWVYVTDQSNYNALPSYYSSEVTYIANGN